MAPAITSARRVLGRTGIEVSPLALSGVFELPGGALLKAHRAGVNLFFWEPRYRAMTRFLRSSPARRRDLVIATGTFHASRTAIEADVDRALRRLRTDHLDIFLIFWVRSPARLSDEVRTCLRDLADKGKIRAAGFSTHDRDLAARAVRAKDWDVVMVRHSAAHAGAESVLFPVAREREVGVLTFSALCYGRMLRAVPGSGAAPSAADCYRYSLSQPGVTACISAPRRHAELVHNLSVLDAPVLDPAAADALRAHGQRVHDRNKDFNALIRREPERMVRDALGRHAGLSGRGVLDDMADAALDELLDDVAPPAHF
jgi:aryl-alcohol dehydrogenase-like predicted oxidoreductase